tara:strand:+ start:1016 stop:1219 length:204 start_codon:yes stop_codon:yes gene_type:complete
MKVVFIEPMAGRDVLYLANEVYDLPQAQADRFIAHGICILDEEVEEVEVKKAVIGNNFKKSKKKGKK